MGVIRFLGGCMIFSGCLGLGLWYRQQFGARIKVLRSLEHILELQIGRASCRERV